jgi:Cys-tRNA(Pro)/Cys-tRNA(Cys) deacylase
MMKKTNAVRILERLNLPYKLHEFRVDESDLSAEKAAELLGLPVERVFKTLVICGDKSGIVVASVPGGSEIDLKKLARLSGNRKAELVPLKSVKQLTGYLRGAVSPLGIKYKYPIFLDESALRFSSIIISAGIRGLQIELSGADLAKATGAVTGQLARDR